MEKDPWIELISKGKLKDPTEEMFQWVKMCDKGAEMNEMSQQLNFIIDLPE